MFCYRNCMRFSSSKCRMIARFNSLHTIGNIVVVDEDIHRETFECSELGAIARFCACSTIGEVALVHADDNRMGFCFG